MAASPVFAQLSAGGLQASGAAYYTFARPGQNTIQVVVLGGGQSGIYEVGENIDLAKLVALSRGIRGDGHTKTTVQLYRPENGKRTLVFEAAMKKFMANSEYPALQSGDIVRIETVRRQGFGWRDVLNILTTATTLVFAFERIFK